MGQVLITEKSWGSKWKDKDYIRIHHYYYGNVSGSGIHPGSLVSYYNVYPEDEHYGSIKRIYELLRGLTYTGPLEESKRELAGFGRSKRKIFRRRR